MGEDGRADGTPVDGTMVGAAVADVGDDPPPEEEDVLSPFREIAAASEFS